MIRSNTQTRAAAVVAVSLGGIAAAAHAAALVTYDFNAYGSSAASNAGAAPSATASGVTASNLAPNASGFLTVGPAAGGPGNYFFPSTTFTASNATGSVGTQAAYTPANIAAAVSANAYYALTLTPAAGNALSFGGGDSLTFDLLPRIFSGGTNPYIAAFYARSSADNFAANLGAPATATTSSTANGTSFPLSIDLSAIGSLPIGQAVTIRLYPTDNSNVANDFKIDNLVIKGSTLTPEPATLAFVGLGAVCLLRRRR